MAISLADALQQVNLEAGRVYQCRVGALMVEVRVEAREPGPLPTPIEPSDVMLDPWIDLPAPPPGKILDATPAAPVLPDAPVIPGDYVLQ
jgi:hypothetical protein